MTQPVDQAEHAEPAAPGSPKGGRFGSGKPAKGDPADRRKQTLVVLGTFAGVVLAFLTYRHAKTSSSGTPAAKTTGTLGSGTVAGSDTSTASNGSLNAIEQMLANLQTQIDANNHGAGATTPTSTPPVPIASTLLAPVTTGALGYERVWDPSNPSSPMQGAIQQIEADGSLLHLTPEQWAGLGSPGWEAQVPSLGQTPVYNTSSNITNLPINQPTSTATTPTTPTTPAT